jgi:hypothetical protein
LSTADTEAVEFEDGLPVFEIPVAEGEVEWEVPVYDVVKSGV